MARLRKSRPSRELSIPRYNTRSTTRKVHQSKVVQPKALTIANRKPVNKRRFRPGSKALKEIRHYQRDIIYSIICSIILITAIHFNRDRIFATTIAISTYYQGNQREFIKCSSFSVFEFHKCKK